MQFSSIRNFALVVLAGSALAVPATTNPNGSLAKAGAQPKTEAFSVIAVILGKVIGGHLFSGAMRAGVDYVIEKIKPAEADSWKDFDEARTKFMMKNIEALYEKREAGANGVICMNGAYSVSPGAVYDGPAQETFKWDIYQTDYSCFDVHSGSITNLGDGGWVNWAASGCPVSGKTMTC